jgi:hypothetical protein
MASQLTVLNCESLTFSAISEALISVHSFIRWASWYLRFDTMTCMHHVRSSGRWPIEVLSKAILINLKQLLTE